MWAIENRTPYAVQRAFQRDREGAEVWVVAVRATFTLHPDGRTTLAEHQRPVVDAPVYLGAPGRSSLLYDSDLVLTKPGTDVLVHGHAYAPAGERASQVTVGLQLGALSKVLEVRGESAWALAPLGVELPAPRPFDRMPLVYERAYGGSAPAAAGDAAPVVDARNPVGTGFAERRQQRPGQRAPNVIYPGDETRPAGFGPLPREWEPRRSLAGTYDREWEETRFPLYAEDLDDRFFHCAPEDQQTAEHLAGGEAVTLRNLTPGGLLQLQLPEVQLAFETHFLGDTVEHQGELHTVVLEPDLQRVQLVWHAALECHGRVHELTHTVVAEEA